jgi:hypothetical protein
MTILQDLTQEQLLAEIARLRANNEALRQSKSRAVSWKVSEKGAVSVYGLGRFPVTLYYSQWQKLFKAMPDVMAFVELSYENGELKTKDDE